MFLQVLLRSGSTEYFLTITKTAWNAVQWDGRWMSWHETRYLLKHNFHVLRWTLSQINYKNRWTTHKNASLIPGSVCLFNVFKKELSDVIYSQVWWPILGIIYPSKVHTHSSEHTHTTHTQSSGQAFTLKCTSVMVLRVEKALYIHFPHLQFLPDRDSHSQPLDYESDSLTQGSPTRGSRAACGSFIAPCSVFVQYAGEVSPRLLIQPKPLPCTLSRSSVLK